MKMNSFIIILFGNSMKPLKCYWIKPLFLCFIINSIMMFNKRFGRGILLALIVVFIIGSSVFFYNSSENFSVSDHFNRLPQWMQDQLNNNKDDQKEN